MRRPLLAGAALALAVSGAAPAAVTLYGLTSAQSGRNLVSFSSDTPGAFRGRTAITGAVDRNIDLFALDLNSRNGLLYSIGSLGGGNYALFTIGYDGVATRVGGTLGVNLGSENAGLDYDAAADVFRVTTTADQVFAVDPSTGVASAGQAFAYAAGDPLGGRNPNIVAAAYDGRLYVLDRNGPGTSGLLSTLSGTTLNSVAALDRAINPNASFDIAASGEAFFDDGSITDHLFQLDLATGRSIDRGALELRLTGLTAAPGSAVGPVPEPATWAMILLGFALTGVAVRRSSPPGDRSARQAALT